MAVKSGVRKVKNRKMKRVLDGKVILGYVVIAVFFLVIFFLIKTLAGFWGGEKASDEGGLYKELRKEIEVEQGEIKMDSDTKGTVELTLTIPDIPALSKKAVKKGADDFDDYIENAIKKGKYDTIETTVKAEVEVANGKTIIKEEEAIKKALEPILIDMVNQVSEMED